MKTDSKTAARIRRIWNLHGHPRRDRVKNILSGGDNTDWSEGTVTYPASALTNVTADFLGDWRAVDSWQRLDMLRVRSRSRQLERGNPMCIGFKRNMLNNVLGAKGFHEKVNVVTDAAFGDSSTGEPDKGANIIIARSRTEFGQAENFTTRKTLDRRDADRLFLSRLMFDGEVILRKQRGWPYNDFGFTWQFINPDYLDHNLNRLCENGNIIRMGIEQDIEYKFPVAYWFLRRRPSDTQFNWQQAGDRYYRVDAEEIIHVYLQTEDDEQTRGWPWVFAAAVNLFRLGKYQESALINAAIGASRGVYFEKKYPEGFMGDPRELQDEENDLVVDLPQGSSLELPYGVEAKVVDMKYPDHEFPEFNKAMMLTAAMVFGTSYATTTGDLSQANFVSSRVGQIEEREQYMAIQEFLINKWKTPGAREETYRALLSRKLNLPISRVDKFDKIEFTGRRWKFVQPVDDMHAKELALNNLTTSISDVIAETSQEDAETLFARIAEDNKLLAKYNLARIVSFKASTIDPEDSEIIAPTGAPSTGAPAA